MNAIRSTAHALQSIDEFALGGDSMVHRFAPLPKVLLTFAFLLLTVSIPRTQPGGTLQLLPVFIIGGLFSHVPFQLLLRRMLPVLPLIGCMAVAELWFDRRTMGMIGDVTVTGGMLSAATLFSKTVLAVGSVLLLAATTPVQRIAGALNALHVPCMLTLQLVLMWRSLGILLEEAAAITSAYHLRAPNCRHIPPRDWGTLAAQLLLRSLERGERVYRAMVCRNFDARNSFGEPARTTYREWGIAMLLLAAMLLLRFPEVLS